MPLSQDALFDDRNALISISGELRDVGTIVNINLGAVRLFGYSRGDMIGRNVSVIMPAPYSSASVSAK
jgi:PAS domain S-box-containing protein